MATRNGDYFRSGLTLGVLAGMLAALLVAPSSGRELRARLAAHFSGLTSGAELTGRRGDRGRRHPIKYTLGLYHPLAVLTVRSNARSGLDCLRSREVLHWGPNGCRTRVGRSCLPSWTAGALPAIVQPSPQEG